MGAPRVHADVVQKPTLPRCLCRKVTSRKDQIRVHFKNHAFTGPVLSALHVEPRPNTGTALFRRVERVSPRIETVAVKIRQGVDGRESV